MKGCTNRKCLARIRSFDDPLFEDHFRDHLANVLIKSDMIQAGDDLFESSFISRIVSYARGRSVLRAFLDRRLADADQ